MRDKKSFTPAGKVKVTLPNGRVYYQSPYKSVREIKEAVYKK